MIIKVLGANLLVFIAYAILIIVNSSSADKGFNIAIGMGVLIAIHVALNGIAGIVCFVISRADLGKSFLISAGVLVPIGFCTWLILLSIYG